MNNLSFPEFREVLLKTDRVPRKLNPNAAAVKDELVRMIESGGIKIENVEKCQCGTALSDRIASVDRFGLPFGAYLCHSCGLVVTSPRIAPDSLPLYYEKFYHILNYGHLHMHDQQALFRLGQGAKIYGILKPFINKQEIDLLEIGAGTGNVLKEFKQEAEKDGLAVRETGTEYSSDCINECTESGINTVYGDLSTILSTGARFDAIILSHVFEHFTDLKTELQRAADLLKDNGLLYIEVPGLMNIHNLNTYNFDFLEYLTHAHMFNFCRASLLAAVEKQGFRNLYATESVESVFLKGEGTRVQNYASAEEILKYLEKLTYCREFLQEGIISFRKGLNNAKEELFNVHRWHEHEKTEAEKFDRWNKAEQERHAVTKKWLDAEKKIVNDLISALDEYFKTPYTSLSAKLKKYRLLRETFEKYKKRYLG